MFWIAILLSPTILSIKISMLPLFWRAMHFNWFLTKISVSQNQVRGPLNLCLYVPILLYGYNALPYSLNDARADFALAYYRQTFLGLAPPLKRSRWRLSVLARGTLSADSIPKNCVASSQRPIWPLSRISKFGRRCCAESPKEKD